MDWLYPRRRGPEWKQGWTGQTMSSVSMPPLPLLAISAIVIFLLSISQSRNYKEQLQHASMNFQLFLFLVPIILIVWILLLRASFTGGWFNLWAAGRGGTREYLSSMQRSGGGFPWGMAVLVVVLLVLVSFQSSFQSKWFFPLS